MMTLPPYRHPKGRSDAPCGICGASANDEPIFTPNFVSSGPRRHYRRYVPDHTHPPVHRCLTCWQKGEGFVGDDYYPVRETIDPVTFAEGGDWTFVCHAVHLDHPFPDEHLVIVERNIPMPYVPEPPETLEPFEADLAHHVEEFLLASGMTVEHLRAVAEKIPEELTGALDDAATATVNNLKAGSFPERGLLFGGGVGGGKTSALAAWFIGFVTNHMRLHAPLSGWKCAIRTDVFQWLYWPDQYAYWNHPGFEVLPEWQIQRFGTEVRLLVIDDVAAETPFTVYGKDQGTTALERIIALRDTNRLPTFITTNLGSTAALYDRYKARTARRIERLNDTFYIKDLPFMTE